MTVRVQGATGRGEGSALSAPLLQRHARTCHIPTCRPGTRCRDPSSRPLDRPSGVVCPRGWERRLTGRKLPTLTSRSEEHTTELQSLMRISYAVFCLKKTKHKN